MDEVLSALDLQASRFRPDSEISWLHRAGGGTFMLSDGLAEAVSVALAAAEWTGGLADPTVGGALISLGYDRDFAAIEPGRRATPAPRPRHRDGSRCGWTGRCCGSRPGSGSTWAPRPRAWVQTGRPAPSRPPPGSRRNAGQPGRRHRHQRDTARGRLAGPRGRSGPTAGPSAGGPAQLVRLACGAVATSSATCRDWRRGGRCCITSWIRGPGPGGRPVADGERGRGYCADANAAATAAIVAGQGARDWLAEAGLPARLVSRGDDVHMVGGWPAADGGRGAYPAWQPRLPGSAARQ